MVEEITLRHLVVQIIRSFADVQVCKFDLAGWQEVC
jgi:hypothetical protein